MNSSTTKQLRKAKFSQDTLVIPMGDHLILNLRSTFPPPPPPKLSENTPIYQINLHIYESLLDKNNLDGPNFYKILKFYQWVTSLYQICRLTIFPLPHPRNPVKIPQIYQKRLYILEFLMGAILKT